MLVVADTSPLSYLVEIGLEHLLPRLFDGVKIPPAVLAELQHPNAPRLVRSWSTSLPVWLEIQEIDMRLNMHELERLDPGEAEAIALALEIGATTILIDDREGATASRNRGLVALGTLALLIEADTAGVMSIDDSLSRLTQTSFRHTAQLLERARAMTAKRRLVHGVQD